MRKITLQLTAAEIGAALNAIGQMTAGNAGDFKEWRSQTCGALAEWRALLRAEQALKTAVTPKEACT